MTPRPRVRRGEPVVSAEPFTRFLQERYAEYERAYNQPDTAERSGLGPSQQLASELGWGASEAGARRLHRYKNQSVERAKGRKREHRWVETAETWPRQVVEDALHRINPDLFYELYPQYAVERDILIEPDAYCPFCKEWVTPIDGLCPWCVCEHGHLFREVGITEDGYACLGCAKKERQAQQRARNAAKRCERKAA